jgi:hypothetical protein
MLLLDGWGWMGSSPKHTGISFALQPVVGFMFWGWLFA